MTPSEWYKSTENEYINKRYIMFGLGDGEYVSEVLTQCQTEVKIILFEPKASGVGQDDADYAELKGLSSSGVEVYVEGKTEDSFTNFIYKFVDFSCLQGMISFIHPDYDNAIYSDAIKYFNESVLAAADGITASRNVKERFGEESYVNMIHNYKHMFESKSVSSLMKNLDTSVPAIIVASGPSLSKNMNLLKEAKGKSFIISADSAVSALLANDIYPDIYLSVDPHKEAKSFEDERVKNIPAIVELTSATHAVKDGQNHFFLFNMGNDYLEKFIDECDVEMHMIGEGGSVANTCFDVAVAFGFSTVIFIGLDLAYTGNKTHVENTARHGMAIDESTVIYTKDIYGETVKSSSEFNLYRTLIEDKIASCQWLNVIDATEGGAYVNGTEVMTFREAVDKYCTGSFDAEAAVMKSENLLNQQQKECLKKYVDNLPNEIKTLASYIRKSLSNYDDMYMMAKMKNLNKNRLTKILSENEELSGLINESPVRCYIEYLAQDAIHQVQENAYKHNNDVYDEILEAASIGQVYDKGMLKGIDKALEVISNV